MRNVCTRRRWALFGRAHAHLAACKAGPWGRVPGGHCRGFQALPDSALTRTLCLQGEFQRLLVLTTCLLLARQGSTMDGGVGWDVGTGQLQQHLRAGQAAPTAWSCHAPLLLLASGESAA